MRRRVVSLTALIVTIVGIGQVVGQAPLQRLPAIDETTTIHDPVDAAPIGARPLSDLLQETADQLAASDPRIPWWQPHVAELQRPNAVAYAVNWEQLVLTALHHSEFVAAISLEPLIREEEILKAKSAFDMNAFLDSKFADTSDPVGNTLTTGGPPRLNEHFLQSRMGMRKKGALGGTFELAQEQGLRDNNSRFFVPRQQATTRTVLSFTQPLLRQNGSEYNRSLIVLAELETDLGQQQTARRLQDHLYQLAETYWDLYLQRALLLQRERTHQQATQILAELETRRELDALRSQLARARAAVATRRAAVLRAELNVRNAESRIGALTNAPALQPENNLELAPQELPISELIAMDKEAALQQALQHRPDIAQAISRVKQAQTRLGVSKNELMPTLNLLLEGYVYGLEGESQLGRSWRDQFDTGSPSYTAGLVFQVPIGNHAAQAEVRKRTREVSQSMHELNAILKTAASEVDIALNDTQAAYHDLEGRYDAMLATEEELQFKLQRWRMLPGDDRPVSHALEDLLDAQDRLLDAEQSVAQAQVEYMLALTRVKQVTGTLVSVHGVPNAQLRQVDAEFEAPALPPDIVPPPATPQAEPPRSPDARTANVHRLPPIGP